MVYICVFDSNSNKPVRIALYYKKKLFCFFRRSTQKQKRIWIQFYGCNRFQFLHRYVLRSNGCIYLYHLLSVGKKRKDAFGREAHSRKNSKSKTEQYIDGAQFTVRISTRKHPKKVLNFPNEMCFVYFRLFLDWRRKTMLLVHKKQK